MPRFSGVTNKRNAFLIFIAASFFVGNTFFYIKSDRDRVIAAARTQSQGLASALNEHAVRAFGDAEATVNNILPLVTGRADAAIPDEGSLHRVLKGYDHNSELITSCFAVRGDGRIYASSRKYPVEGVDVSSAHFFKYHHSSPSEDIAISPPFRSPFIDQPVITVTKRVSYPDGTLRMIVGVSIDPSYFSRFYRTTGLGPQDRAILIHRSGNVLAHAPFSKKAMDHDFSDSRLFLTELPKSPLSGTYFVPRGFVDDSRRIISYRTTSRYPIIAMISLREDGVLSQWRMRTLATLAGATFFALLVSALGVFIYRQLNELRRTNEALTFKEDALQASERRFRELLENINLVAVILDVEGRVVFCNDCLLTLTGWKREEVVGANWFDVFIPDGVKHGVHAVFTEGVTKGEVAGHFENAIVTRNGTERVIVWDNIVLHNADHSIAGTASIGMDVTDHRHLEEQLRQSQKLEALGKLAGGVAHDFNNILSVITGYGHLLLMRLDEDDANRPLIQHINDAAERAAILTRGLLAFSREQLITPQKLDLHDIIRRVTPFFQGLLGENISLQTLLHDQALHVVVDSVQVEQVLMNLVTNARDAMPDGGVLTVATEVQEIGPAMRHAYGCDSPGRFAVLSVTDTGVGMDKELMRRVFEPFYTTKDVGKGTGLGLAMVYGMVKSHNGFIRIASQPGTGTTFKVFFPLTEAEEEPVPPLPASSPQSGTQQTARSTPAAVLLDGLP